MAAALGVTSMLGCAPLAMMGNSARDTFSEQLSCPKASIAVVQRIDVPASGTIETPPADVASDPARFAVWQKNHPPDDHQRSVMQVRAADKSRSTVAWSTRAATTIRATCRIARTRSAFGSRLGKSAVGTTSA